jgi:hypothetical protein
MQASPRPFVWRDSLLGLIVDLAPRGPNRRQRQPKAAGLPDDSAAPCRLPASACRRHGHAALVCRPTVSFTLTPGDYTCPPGSRNRSRIPGGAQTPGTQADERFGETLSSGGAGQRHRVALLRGNQRMRSSRYNCRTGRSSRAASNHRQRLPSAAISMHHVRIDADLLHRGRASATNSQIRTVPHPGSVTPGSL